MRQGGHAAEGRVREGSRDGERRAVEGRQVRLQLPVGDEEFDGGHCGEYHRGPDWKQPLEQHTHLPSLEFRVQVQGPRCAVVCASGAGWRAEGLPPPRAAPAVASP